VAFTHCNSQTEAEAVVAELAAPSRGACCIAYRLGVRGPFQFTQIIAGGADTFNRLDAATHNPGVNRRDMATHMNERG
jgi:hypothetical protein